MIGLSVQAASFILLATAAGSTHILPLLGALALSGSAAGFSIAALHHTAMYSVAAQNAGSAAGLHSMIRFIGALFGSAVAGVVLEQGLGNFAAGGLAYRGSFVVMAAVGCAGFLLSLTMKEIKR